MGPRVRHGSVREREGSEDIMGRRGRHRGGRWVGPRVRHGHVRERECLLINIVVVHDYTHL